jgi:hypothetical protein
MRHLPARILSGAFSSGKNNNGIWAKVLAYVTNRAIMKRLDEVCGKAGWRNEYRDIPNNGGVECGISIKVEGEWITKWDAAENTQVEAVKGGRSGAMKRAAVQWGSVVTSTTWKKGSQWFQQRARPGSSTPNQKRLAFSTGRRRLARMGIAIRNCKST